MSAESKETQDVGQEGVSVPTSLQIWVCPHPDCDSWYGSSTAGDLATSINRRSAMRNAHNEPAHCWGEAMGTRAECQVCRQQGRGRVERLLVTYVEASTVVQAIQKATAETEAAERKRDQKSMQAAAKLHRDMGLSVP